MSDQDLVVANPTAVSSFTMRDLVAIPFRHKKAPLLCFLGMMLGTILTALLMQSEYRSEMKILVKRERVDPVVSAEQSTPVQMRGDVSEEELNSEIGLMQSEDVLREVVVNCNLQNRKGILASVSSLIPSHRNPERKIAKAVLALRAKLKVEPVRKSDLINVTYTNNDPKLAALVLQTLGEAYIKKHVAVHSLPGQMSFFEQETDRNYKQLQEAEAKLSKFSLEQGGVAPQITRDMSLQKLSDFNATVQQTRSELASTEHRIHDLQAQAARTPARVTTQLHEADNAATLQNLKSTLSTLELKRTELLTKYQPTHRLIQEVDKQIADTRASIVSEGTKPIREQTTDQNPTYAWISAELAKAQADYSALQAREVATEAIVARYQKDAQALDQKGLQHQDLVREQKADEDNYLLYLHKREEARMADALDRSRILNVAIAEPAMTPTLPTVEWWMYILIGTLVSVTASVMLLFLLEYFDNSFRTAREVAYELNIPVLATLPDPNGHGVHSNGRIPRLESVFQSASPE
jgi:uncharacterized protein involved in exopolysaccharide biosynthesis